MTTLDRVVGALFAVWCVLSLAGSIFLADRERVLDTSEALAEKLSGIADAVWVVTGTAAVVGLLASTRIFGGRWWAYGLCSLASTTILLALLPAVDQQVEWWVLLPIPLLFSGYFARRFWQRASWRHARHR